jgi:hypothetical protein
MRLEELGSSISDNQFILHILNNMTDDYDLQLAMMEKRVTKKSKRNNWVPTFKRVEIVQSD